jgi:NAD(P)H-dependent flavin oxidoreductase YrpB (nitropropane dioxygenase family)
MLPEQWRERLRVPVIAAPMTNVSGPELVAAACAAGVIGTFPAHNTADSDELARWLRHIGERTAALTPPGRLAAPAGVNLVVHRSNARLAADLRAVIGGGAEVVVTSVGSPREIIGPLHDAGLTVLADVASMRHVRRAQEAGADGVVLLAAAMDDITTTTQLTGLAANVLTAWLDSVEAEPDGTQAQAAGTGAVARGFAMDQLLARRGVWAAGHSAEGTRDVLGVADLVRRLESELRGARGRLTGPGDAAGAAPLLAAECR